MPRPIDPRTEKRILDAARRLWHQGGEKALSMRAVAKLARTNTPAVYRRFRHREDILRALVQSFQSELCSRIEGCGSLREAVNCYLEFALERPREYQLMTSGLIPRITKARPTLDMAFERSATWMGGSAGDHRGLVLTLGALVHGTAMWKIAGIIPKESLPALEAAFAKGVETLIANENRLRDRKPGI
jgi:AcrR family transcriptional regulator